MGNAHAKVVETLNKQLEASTEEAKSAKTMLFNTIREGESKLERSLHLLQEDHCVASRLHIFRVQSLSIDDNTILIFSWRVVSGAAAVCAGHLA